MTTGDSEDQIGQLQKFGQRAGIIPEEEKPQVIVPGGIISITESAAALFAQLAPTKKVFIRAGEVTHLAMRDGRTVLEPLRPTAARSKFEEFVQFVRITGDKDGKRLISPTTISKDQAESYLHAEARFTLPVISGVLGCPLVVERKGELRVIDSGYDPATQLLITTQIPLSEVSLPEAVEMLKALLDEFDFQTPGDRSRAIASLITPAMRFGGLLQGFVPADVGEADKSQSGKSYRQQMIAALYHETLSVITKKENTGVGSLEESFGTHLLDGHPFIQFDNIRGKFHLQTLESFLTARGRFSARAAYSRQTDVDPSKYIILINSNGYETTADLSNRSSIIRIRKKEGYQFKRWAPLGQDRGTMVDFVRDCQALLLSCVFRVIKEWFDLGKCRTSETRHDFRDWCQTLDWIVQNIFGEAPLMDGHQEAQSRVSSPDHTFIRSVALALAVRNRLDQDLRANEIFDLSEESQLFIPGLSTDKRHDADAAKKVIGKIMARLFGESETVAVDTFTVIRKSTMETSASMNVYPGRVYRFLRAPANASPRQSPEATPQQANP